MAATSLAIRLYELDHERPPESLDELIPDYLPAIPLDPFHPDNAIIGYLPNAERPRLYSVGPNGFDDDGEYGFRSDGKINLDALDMPFFLTGPKPVESDEN